jgi:large subunit ribosomal protein L19
MSNNLLIERLEKKYMNSDHPDFKIGDSVRVHIKIIEGQKERIQAFAGVVIAKKGKGLSETFTVYRNAYGSSMERVFIINSPRIMKIEIEKKGQVRKAKLYYIRGKTGKAAKIKEKLHIKKDKKVAVNKEAVKASDESAAEPVKNDVENKEEKK